MADLVLSPGPPQPDLVTSGDPSTDELELSGQIGPDGLATQTSVAQGELVTGVIGIKGDKGDPGSGGSGSSNLFVQVGPAPSMPTPGMWVELNPDLTPKTVWVGTNP